MSDDVVQGKGYRRSVLWRLGGVAVMVTLVTVGLGCRAVWAQVAANGQQTAEPSMMAKDADPGWEVATVKPSDPNDTVSHISIQGRRVMIEGEPAEAMLKFAYGTQSRQIMDAPEWLKKERWDVAGVPDAPGRPNLPQFQSMMQKLLAERFGLKLHHEQREMPVFALTVTKAGPKLEKSPNQNLGPSNNGGLGSGGIEAHRYSNASMQDLALMLMIYVDRPIVDQTELQGRYDFQLQWIKDETDATAADAPPGLFTAMQEQLGLKLEPAKVPSDVLVIDQVNRPGVN